MSLYSMLYLGKFWSLQVSFLVFSTAKFCLKVHHQPLIKIELNLHATPFFRKLDRQII